MAQVNLRCGDDLRIPLKNAGISGRYLKWCDPVCDGPTPALEGEDWYVVRAHFISLQYCEPFSDVHGELKRQDAELAALGEDDDVVFWCEHDLFDQAILVRLLAWFADHPVKSVSLVQTGRHLVELTPDELRTAFQNRRILTAQDLAIGRDVWKAWRSPHPEKLLLQMRTCECLPYLPQAIRRHFQEFPWTSDGLGLTERLAIAAIAAGSRSAQEIFASVGAAEEAAWMADSMFWPVLGHLAREPLPLIRKTNVEWALTTLGSLAASGEFVRKDIEPRWYGGVFVDQDNDWRWDEVAGSVERVPSPGAKDDGNQTGVSSRRGVKHLMSID